MSKCCFVLNAFVCFLAVSVELAAATLLAVSGDDGTPAEIRTLAVGPAPNDFFASALKVNAQPVFIHSAITTGASMEAGEAQLAHGGDANASASIWYSWSVRERTELLVDTAGSGFNTVIGVYTGTSIAALTEVAEASSAIQGRDAWVRFVAEPNVSYKIAVAGIPPAPGGLVRVRFEENGLPDLAPPLLEITRPVSGTTLRDPRVRIEGFALDPMPNASGIREVQFTLSTEGNAIVRAAQGTTNFAATVDLFIGENIVTMWAVDNADQTSEWRRVSVMLNPVLSTNDLFVDRIMLDPAANSRADLTIDATKETREPAHAGNGGGASIWYEFAADRSGVLLLNTLGSDFDTLLAVYVSTNLPPAIPTVTNLLEVASSDDVPGGGYSELTVTVEAGRNYFIAIDGFDGQIGFAQLNYLFEAVQVYRLTVLPAIGNGSVTPGSGAYPENASITLLARPEEGHLFEHFETPTGQSRQNPLSIVMRGDTTVRAVFRERTYAEDFEGGFSFAFEGGGWSVQMDPTNRVNHVFAALGSGSDRTTNIVSLTLRVSEGIGSFDFGVSTETNYDRLEFSVSYVQNGDSSTPMRLGFWSGEARGRHQFALRSGTARLEWRYVKDAAISDGRDWVFIDNLDLPLFTIEPEVTIVDRTVLVQLAGLDGQSVRVETSFDLQTWTPLRTASPDAGGEIELTERADGPARFYRFIPVLTPE